MCSVLGWLRAANRELAGIEVGDQEQYRGITDSIDDFEASLAESRFLAESRLAFLFRDEKNPLEALNVEEKEQLGRAFEKKIWKALNEENVSVADELGEGKKKQLLNDLVVLLQKSGVLTNDDPARIEQLFRSSIEAISRVESWIYRDWQSAIGDFMLTEPLGTNRRFDVIGFSEFEDLFIKHLNKDEEDNRWLERIVRLFQDLQVSRDNKFDARVQQLRNICSAGVALVEVLSEVDEGLRPTREKEWDEVKKFDRDNNPRFYEKKEEETKAAAETAGNSQ